MCQSDEHSTDKTNHHNHKSDKTKNSTFCRSCGIVFAVIEVGFKNFLHLFLKKYFEHHLSLHSPEKRNGSSGLTARRSASVERCKMAVTRD